MEIHFINQIKNGINVPWRQQTFSKSVELINDLESVTSVQSFTGNEDDHIIQTATALRVKAGTIIYST